MSAEINRLWPREDDGCALAFLLAHDAPCEPQAFIPIDPAAVRAPEDSLIVVP